VEGLVEAGIEYEVVPGVTAPLGIAAYTGVPLTHRDHTSVVTFVTGHDVSGIDWNKTGVSETLVVFMGLQHLPEIVERLLAAGRSPDTPAMAVRWGTRSDQKTIAGKLADLPRLTAEARLAPPTTVIIGEVVGLHDKLDWFGKRPLSGQRVVVTRAAAQAADLSQPLHDLGADVCEVPVIELAPLDDYSALDAAIGRLSSYDWVIFTSTNAVEYFLQRLRACNRDARALRGRLCAIGPATRDALQAAHLRADLVPDEAVAERLADAFASIDMSGKRVLLPRAAAAREVIPQALSAMGAHVDIADAYRNIVPVDAAARTRSAGPFHWITFTSGSTVKNWLSLAGRDSLEGVRIASIGPATSDVIRKHGLAITAEADPHTVSGLIDAILRASK
jgi:uroporphyrinogen III methyltransferase/synthase